MIYPSKNPVNLVQKHFVFFPPRARINGVVGASTVRTGEPDHQIFRGTSPGQNASAQNLTA